MLPAPMAAAVDWLRAAITLQNLQSLIVLMTGLGFFPQQHQAAHCQFCNRVFECHRLHLNGAGRDQIEGGLKNLLQRLAETKGYGAYNNVWIVGFSFGSIIAVKTRCSVMHAFDRLSGIMELHTMYWGGDSSHTRTFLDVVIARTRANEGPA